MEYRKENARKSLPAWLVCAVCTTVLLVSLSACSTRIGWGVMLWTLKGTEAKAGTIVPVYLKSNITKVYVIGAGEKGTERLEVPLWQLEMFGSKRAATARAEEFGALRSTYLIAGRDGLPVRDEPTNTSKRAYRLRADEMVKALEIVDGEDVFTGTTKLPGNWYKVLTADGTRGYVFSYIMHVFDEATGILPEQRELSANPESANTLFSNTWRPAWYSTMLGEGTIDLDSFSLRFGLFGDAVNSQMRIELPAISKVFQYSSITQENGWLVFGSTTLKIKIESGTSLIAVWGSQTVEEPEDSAGWKADDTYARFIVVQEDIRDAIRGEESRRAAALREFFSLAQKSTGSKESPGSFTFASDSAGSIEMWTSGSYTWAGIDRAPAGFAPSSDSPEEIQKGVIVFGLTLSKELALLWQGGFSLYPDATGLRSDYVYRFDARGMAIARVALPYPGLPTDTIEKRFGTLFFEFSNQE